MPAKTPIYLKTSTPKHGKKLKLRDVLSSDMISPPLGDFRHSAHIGLDGEGDMFGELSFLQGKYDLLPSLHRKQGSQSTDGGLHEEYNINRNAGAYPTLLKSAVSLPVFSGVQGTQCQEQAPPKPPRLHLEEGPAQRSMSVSCAPGHFHSNEEVSSFSTTDQMTCSNSFSVTSITSSEDSVPVCRPLDPSRGLSFDSDSGLNNKDLLPQESTLQRSESLLRLDLDLGPSILDDVLRIMDDYNTQGTKEL
ncbi:cdc42 effector protein 2 [Latimeria chalumnae]|uniref:Zgc:154093 n=1 Tax=Latimeria chalumnae TaxID=7897 RepID=H3BA51_LATCH|nr:PREDICTED: cdc42 effector protein 2-like [Latimeria chalumnae]XP_005991669.1 PREDICTED: cdc42 effector protein 2-like [Latimeria chalumnae]XP_005991670.1 PREDICTED: cdc42 effector protein 2-like [Latimeria chalumnae]XP_005991671.1 PREDICTED: cdc42 effector protein 2-like [Latimeria chalumnae]|eukprot:XP_005991668.1 PREDICTED: cdc42 effector protein 2-like [Latimeria chalumnae]